MESGTATERFERRLWLRPLSPAVEINKDGLVAGAGTVLARMRRDPSGEEVLALDEDRSRLLALLSAAYGRSPPSDLLAHLEGAARFWKRGDKALANIRLAFARLPRLDDRADAYRLFLAESVLDEGMTPDALMKVIGLAERQTEIGKFDPNQPRVPAGNGRSSGQWTSGGATSEQTAPAAAPSANTATAGAAVAPPAAAAGIVAPAAVAAETLAEGLFGAGAASEFLAGLAVLGATIGVGVVGGAVFFPRATGRRFEGPVPGDETLRYIWNADESAMRFIRDGVAGPETVAAAVLGGDGIFRDAETESPLGRLVDGRPVFDAQLLSRAAGDASTRTGAQAREDAKTDEGPRLCPDPGPDRPHGEKERAGAYKEQISRLVNPQRPLPRELSMALPNPKTGKLVHFDECRESDGTMIEAKGPGLANLLKAKFGEKKFKKDWTEQADRQISAAGSRDIEWYFAEPEAAAAARKLFDGQERFNDIKTFYVPADKR